MVRDEALEVDVTHLDIRYFDGSYAPSGLIGRTNKPLFRKPGRWAGAALAAALLFSTGAGAIALRTERAAQVVADSHTLPAGNGGAWGGSFAVALY
jgi:hypothetical protein